MPLDKFLLFKINNLVSMMRFREDKDCLFAFEFIELIFFG